MKYGSLLLLLIFSLFSMMMLDRPLVRGDGLAYWAWVDTLVLDHDLDFGNQLAQIKPLNNYQIEWNDETGKLVNIFPFGVAIFQAPFYLIGHAFAQVGWWDDSAEYFLQMQGFGRSYSLWLMIGANFWACLLLITNYAIARTFLSRPWAAILTFAFFLGTPLIYYTTISPLNSHLPGALCYSLILYLLVRLHFGKGSPRLWSIIGLLSGLMILSRWQLALVVMPAVILIKLSRDRWNWLIIGGGLFLVSILPLPLIWDYLFGRAFVIPYNEVNATTNFLTLPRHTLDVLWHTVLHSPLIGISLLGIVRFGRVSRRWAVYAFLVIGLQLWINGGVLDWWAGETYGMRRMSELLPLYTLLGAVMLQTLFERFPKGGKKAGQLFFCVAIGWSLAYLLFFVNFTWTNQAGIFIADPMTMARHFFAQPNHWQISKEVWQAHLGPWAWQKPGP